MSERAQISTNKRKPVWRRACLTYGELRRVGASDREALHAAASAVGAVWLLPWTEAKAEAANAFAYATQPHVEWFWQGRAKLWGTRD